MICLQVEDKAVNLFFCEPAIGPPGKYKEKVCLVRAVHSGVCVFVWEEEDEEEEERKRGKKAAQK